MGRMRLAAVIRSVTVAVAIWIAADSKRRDG